MRLLYNNLGWSGGDELLRVMVFIVIMTIAYTALASGCLWACFAEPASYARFVVLFFLAVGTSAIPLLLFPLDRSGRILVPGSAFLGCGLVFASLMILRWTGYRLARPNDAPSASEAAEYRSQ
ncbi:MAG TPA: hypothetical protein VMX74_09135 [Pirellulales bacterium]|nr:hypothetical protein [Pirellulales bacterium]